MESCKYDVGGIIHERPFRIRRLGHFGFNVKNTKETIHFYCNLLGFRISDPMDIALNHPNERELKSVGDTNLYFTRHGTDHHSFVFCDRNVFNSMGRGKRLSQDVTVNQITWQVASLNEVVNAIDYFEKNNIPINRSGRDMPGSNWHVYPYDPEGHRNELYYGIEQIGWLGSAKPQKAYERRFLDRPKLPQIPEYEEVEFIRNSGIELSSGFRHPEEEPAIYDVEGILLPRPFKVVRIGPVGIYCKNIETMLDFYTNSMGFELTEEIIWNGYKCYFLRCNTEHHSLALFPIEIREILSLEFQTTTFSFGIQLGSYKQLRSCIKYLLDNNCKLINIPKELTPGIDFNVHFLDPCGHPIMLYFNMEQIGINNTSSKLNVNYLNWETWPDQIERPNGAFLGEQFLGPLG